LEELYLNYFCLIINPEKSLIFPKLKIFHTDEECPFIDFEKLTKLKEIKTQEISLFIKLEGNELEKVYLEYDEIRSTSSNEIENIEALKAGENVTLLNSYNNCKKYFVAMKYNIKNVYIVYSSYQGILPGKDLNYSGFIINNQFYNDSELIIDSISGDIEKELKKRIPDTAAATVLFESINKDRYHHLLVEGAKKCDRKHEAKKLFFDDKKPELNIFNRRNDIKLTHVVDYLVDPEKVIDELTSYYIEYFSKDILVSYIIYDSTVAAYNEIKYNSTADHISKMKEIYNELRDKPEWLTMEDINEYEKQMTV
jgi:hypothetical protein